MSAETLTDEQLQLLRTERVPHPVRVNMLLRAYESLTAELTQVRTSWGVDKGLLELAKEALTSERAAHEQAKARIRAAWDDDLRALRAAESALATARDIAVGWLHSQETLRGPARQILAALSSTPAPFAAPCAGCAQKDFDRRELADHWTACEEKRVAYEQAKARIAELEDERARLRDEHFDLVTALATARRYVANEIGILDKSELLRLLSSTPAPVAAPPSFAHCAQHAKAEPDCEECGLHVAIATAPVAAPCAGCEGLERITAYAAELHDENERMSGEWVEWTGQKREEWERRQALEQAIDAAVAELESAERYCDKDMAGAARVPVLCAISALRAARSKP